MGREEHGIVAFEQGGDFWLLGYTFVSHESIAVDLLQKVIFVFLCYHTIEVDGDNGAVVLLLWHLSAVFAFIVQQPCFRKGSLV